MKKLSVLLFSSIILAACNKDEDRVCRFCSSDQTAEFELCREPNGNASVNGEDTGTDYEAYLDDLVEAGANCGG